jgi:hypothetical protein
MSASGNGSNATSGPTHRRSSSAGSLPPSAARRGVTSASLRQAPTPTPTPARDDSSVTRTTPSKVAPSPPAKTTTRNTPQTMVASTPTTTTQHGGGHARAASALPTSVTRSPLTQQQPTVLRHRCIHEFPVCTYATNRSLSLAHATQNPLCVCVCRVRVIPIYQCVLVILSP